MILPRSRVLIVGGGPAGSACAIALAGERFDITIVEKHRFPRTKVCGCCLGGAGLATLDRLGVGDQVRSAGVRLATWTGSFDGREVTVDLPDGMAISREALDPILLRAAERSGATVRMETAAVLGDDGIAILDGREEKFDVIVNASGLSGLATGQRLPWIRPPSGPFGVSFTADLPLPVGTIAMACDDDGYVGLVRLNDGRVDVAAALTSGSRAAGRGRPIDRVRSMLRRSSFHAEIEAPSRPLVTPPLRRQRVAGDGRLVSIGDAAGYVEPFTGEGMTWAMRSGVTAADWITYSKDLGVVGDRWDRRLHRSLGRDRRVCAAVTTALRSRSLRRAAALSLSWLPGLAHPLVAHLAATNDRADRTGRTAGCT